MKEKPKYNILQNVGFMLKMGWRAQKSVIFICLLLAILNVAVNMLQLFIAPTILVDLEQSVPLNELIKTIVTFSLALFFVKMIRDYFDHMSYGGRNETRFLIRDAIIRKACTTAYSNATNPEFIKAQEDAIANTSSKSQATGIIWVTITAFLTHAADFVIYLLMLGNLNTFLAIVVLITSVIGYYVTKRMRQWGYVHRQERGKYLRQFNYISDKTESAALAKDIRIFGLESWLADIQESALRAYDSFVTRRERNHRIASIVDVALTFARNGVAYAYLIYSALSNDLSAAEFVLYLNTVTAFSAKVSGILSDLSTLYTQNLELSAIQEFLNTPEPFCHSGGKDIPQSDTYELRLDNVTFRYPGADLALFDHLNLTIHPGEKLAIVGLNGAGKTTLVKLLCGFLDPDEGSVLLNGTDIRQFNRQEYYHLFSAVFQEYSLLDVTLKENVAHSSSNIDEELVWDCLAKAGLNDMVRSLPNQLETHIGRDVFADGILLSGGQTQRLMLARALYKRGSVLVLDEPTAALDPIAENDIYLRYNSMTAGKTSLFISHRLASTRFCDRIIFLANGTITEEGTHEQLLLLGGEYAKLFAVQSRYYQEGEVDSYEEI